MVKRLALPGRVLRIAAAAAATLVLAHAAPAASAGTQDKHKKVLVLYSTRRDGQFSIVGEAELPRMLDAGLDRNLDYYPEFIDLTRFPDPAYKLAFRDFLRQKYRSVELDLVIAMQDSAVDLVEAYRDSLFPGVPEVFLANTPPPRRAPGSTGLIHVRDYASTLTLIRRLQPDVSRVFIVTGAAAADRKYEAAVRKQLGSHDPRLTVSYLSGLATSDLVNRLSKLPGRSAVYYVLVSQDGAGHKFHPLEYIDRVTAAANAPTYSWVDSTMDHGIVGGSLYVQRDAIERVGELALRVLRGEPADTIPVAALHLNANQVDWRQLRRWGIDEARVPPGTLVRFREPTVWDRYKAYILAAAALLLAQSVLITGLLIQRRRRRQAEGKLRASQGELLRSYERNRDLAARLLRAQENERSRIARELHDDICQRMLVLTVDLKSLEGPNDREGRAAEALAVAQGIAKSLHELSHSLHPTKLRLLGLVAAIDQLRLDLSRIGITTSFSHHDVPSTLPPDLMLCLFRIVQEAIQNAIKYSKASEVSVRLSGSSDRLTVTISDNGVGFDVEAAWSQGLGLLSMVERAEALGGSLEIHSSPGAGARLTASVPLHAARSTGVAL
ncbi:MAG TPA: ATP-binding protein [Thermoanaerobaculia bacterium]|jgi:signal transduction histidine kinase